MTVSQIFYKTHQIFQIYKFFTKMQKKRFDEDKDFQKKAHENVVKLQSGDVNCLAGWKMLC